MRMSDVVTDLVTSGQKLKLIREMFRPPLSQAGFARRTGSTREKISAYELDRALPPQEFVDSLGSMFGVSSSEMYRAEPFSPEKILDIQARITALQAHWREAGDTIFIQNEDIEDRGKFRTIGDVRILDREIPPSPDDQVQSDSPMLGQGHRLEQLALEILQKTDKDSTPVTVPDLIFRNHFFAAFAPEDDPHGFFQEGDVFIFTPRIQRRERRLYYAFDKVRRRSCLVQHSRNGETIRIPSSLATSESKPDQFLLIGMLIGRYRNYGTATHLELEFDLFGVVW